MNDVTRILSAIEDGDSHAAGQLLPLVYDELRKLAAQKLANEQPGQTLQPTALVHEAYLRLVHSARGESQGANFANRAHFFAAAAEAMRRILVDEVRRKLSQKQGGARRRCELSEDDRIALPLNDEIVDLDDALSKLAAADPQAAELVKLRVFAGMTIEEVAEVQGISSRTVKRNWAYARAWLGRELAAYDERQA
jgi:RNA polymerase sigma factor (TIGR02999 family)